jgi:hypothetical protein
MYRMMYEVLASIGGMVIGRGGEMLPQNIKKLPQGESLEQKDGGSRGKYR